MLKKILTSFFTLNIVLSAFSFAIPATAKMIKATDTEISLVDGIAVDKKGNVFITMRDHNIISRVDTRGNITRFAGTGESGYSGDGGKATAARGSI